ncbi:MAG: S1C family serine protease [Polyangiaceae bacterium]
MRAVVAAAVALLAVGCAAQPPPAPSPPRPTLARSLTPADIAARALPSVVTIRTQRSLGTGFLVKPDGWIATNLHVVVGGPKVVVTLRDGRQLPVIELLAANPDHDLALVRVAAHGLPALALGDSDAMRPGDPVVAIGNPMGLEDTVSNGLVSARRKVQGGALEVLQVSAPIAPGSSGGPIFNDRGEVIGVATAVVEGGQNLAFGMPVRYLLPMIAQPAPMPFAEFATLIANLREAGAAKVKRKVPHHPVSFLDGCSQEAQKLVVKMLGAAIEAGAPLYNAGKPDACYHVYDGAASDLGRKLPSACQGPVRALAEAQHHAASLPDPSAQAWAMRDAFDGLLDVVARKQER